MDFMLQPILLSDGNRYCYNAGTKTTQVLIDGDCVIDGANGYKLFHCPNLNPPATVAIDDYAVSDRAYQGAVEFGVTSCGVTSVRVDVHYFFESMDENIDKIQIIVNDVIVKEFGSVKITYPNYSPNWPSAAGDGTFANGDGTYSRPYEVIEGTGTYTIPIPQTPCGTKIRIVGLTTDEVANNETRAWCSWNII